MSVLETTALLTALVDGHLMALPLVALAAQGIDATVIRLLLDYVPVKKLRRFEHGRPRYSEPRSGLGHTHNNRRKRGVPPTGDISRRSLRQVAVRMRKRGARPGVEHLRARGYL